MVNFGLFVVLLISVFFVICLVFFEGKVEGL